MTDSKIIYAKDIEDMFRSLIISFISHGEAPDKDDRISSIISNSGRKLGAISNPETAIHDGRCFHIGDILFFHCDWVPKDVRAYHVAEALCQGRGVDMHVDAEAVLQVVHYTRIIADVDDTDTLNDGSIVPMSSRYIVPRIESISVSRWLCGDRDTAISGLCNHSFCVDGDGDLHAYSGYPPAGNTMLIGSLHNTDGRDTSVRDMLLMSMGDKNRGL